MIVYKTMCGGCIDVCWTSVSFTGEVECTVLSCLKGGGICRHEYLKVPGGAIEALRRQRRYEMGLRSSGDNFELMSVALWGVSVAPFMCERIALGL